MATKEIGDFYCGPAEYNGIKKPYTAVALQIGSPAIYKREEIKTVAIPHIRRLLNLAIPSASIEYPTRLVCLTEGGLQGWDAEYSLGSREFCQEMAVEVPGEETELLGDIAKKHNVYLVGTIKTIEPEVIKDRYFNTTFLIDPKGEVILKHFKLQVGNVERSVTPHDVWDRYVAKYGDGLDAFFQVAATDIGKIGLTICNEGRFPEIYRCYALQGAEVVTHCDSIMGAGPDWWVINNRARALDNNIYMICPNGGPLYHKGRPDEPSYNICGGHSMIVDYRGQMLSKFDSICEGFASATIDVQRLREYRSEVTTFTNFLPMLRTEVYRKAYEQPIYPKNAWLERESSYSRFDALVRESVKGLQKRGVFEAPEVSPV